MWSKMLTLILLYCIAACSALPSNVILSKLDDGARYQYEVDSNGDAHLVDLWLSLDNIGNMARYIPSISNSYNLFTRENPSVSQSLSADPDLLSQTNYNSTRRTVVLIHGWRNSASSEFNTVLVPVLLAAEDLNVIVVDWSAGSSSLDYREVNFNCITSASAVTTFIRSLNLASGSTMDQYHFIGHGVGAHQAGMLGRNLGREVPYITALDPAMRGWDGHLLRFRATDGLYTEVIHTNVGLTGYRAELGRVDFYPNGGVSMPGCDSNACDHERSYNYLAESITSGGFTGVECVTYYAAILKMCSGPKTLQMGGLTPKPRDSGIYLVSTNDSPPFSQG